MQADRQQMKTKQLHQVLVQHAISKHNLPEDYTAQLLSQVASKLGGSSQFGAKGKYTLLPV